MEKFTAAISLGVFILSYLLYQRLTATDKDDFKTVARRKNAENPIGDAIARGYQTVRRQLALKKYS